MPAHVRPRAEDEGGKRWKIVDPDGRIVGESDTRSDAEASARIRSSKTEKRAAFELRSELAKVDEDRGLVFGWFSVIEENGAAVVDTQGDVIPVEELEKAAYDFNLHARATDLMHDQQSRGVLIESIVLTKEKQAALGIEMDRVGWWGGFKVADSAIRRAVREGTLAAFSIGGFAESEEMP